MKVNSVSQAMPRDRTGRGFTEGSLGRDRAGTGRKTTLTSTHVSASCAAVTRTRRAKVPQPANLSDARSMHREDLVTARRGRTGLDVVVSHQLDLVSGAVPKGASVLEVGCGKGELASAL